jgi:hypothetical protein
MKILFFGRGVVGTQYAWAFENAGHTVYPISLSRIVCGFAGAGSGFGRKHFTVGFTRRFK